MNLRLPGGRDSQGLWEGHVHTAVFKMDNQQRPTVQHMELCSMLWAGWEGVLGRMDICVCIAESLCCPPETITILLIGYIPIQNKKLKKKE